MGDLISILIILSILGISLGYIINAKKKVVKCIGCPSAKTCSNTKNCSCCNSEKK